MADLITLADAKTQLRIPVAAVTDDALLYVYIAAVVDVIENMVGPVLPRQIVNEYVDLIGRTIYNELTTAGARQIVLRNRQRLHNMDA